MEIDELRKVDLNEIMIGFGYERDGKQSDSRRNVYITKFGKISIMGLKFFNFSENKGGGGAIDLIMYLRNCSFIEACKFLNNNYYYSEKTTTTRKINNIKQYISNIPERNGSKINIVVDYLVNIRKIPSDFVNLLVKHNAIYANSYGSVVFRHCSLIPEELDGEYRVNGATIRGTHNKFKQTIGNKEEGLFWFGINVQEAKEVVVAESPIDIVSYAVIKGINQNTCYISLSGISFPSSLKNLLPLKNIILAIDNPDFEKNATAKAANLKLEKELKEIGSFVNREIPHNKDWNEDLIYKGVKK